MKKVETEDVVARNGHESDPPRIVTGVLGLHNPKTQLQKQHTQLEIERVLARLEAEELVAFADYSGVLAGLAALKMKIPY